MRDKTQKKYIAINKEIDFVQKQEEKLKKSAQKAKDPEWKKFIEEKVPEKAFDNLEKAFCTAFSIIFDKGTGLIEKGYDRQAVLDEYDIKNYEFQVRGNRKTLANLHRQAGKINMKNMAVTTAEGIGLGALGIGLPDIVIFTGVLLKGVYELSLSYGFDYNSAEEKMFILSIMEASMQKGEAWIDCNNRLNQWISGVHAFSSGKEDIEYQIRQTAKAFATDMVLMKFVQGLPVVGVIGGAQNPVYYNKVMKYAELKYRKRYLFHLQAEGNKIF